MFKLLQFIKRRGIFILMFLSGLYFSCSALWGLTNTLLYYHEAVKLTGTVRDVRQRPFESYTEALSHGNLPWQGDVAYRPILTFIMPAGITIRAYTSPDLDTSDYRRGEQVEIITHPHDPNQAHVNKWKFLWGADCMKLSFGILLAVPSWLVLFPLKKRSSQRKSTPRPRTQQPNTHSQTQARQAPKPEQTFFAQEPLHAAEKPRTTQRKRGSNPDSPKKTRAPRKKKETAPEAQPKARKKKAEQ